MDILNFISWIKGKRQFTTVDPAQSVLPVGIKDPKRDDDYLTGAITVENFADVVAGVIPPGPTGPQGIAGPAGVPGPVGPAGLNWQGAWVSGATYALDDAVGFGGASYFCINATSGTTAPNLNTTDWALLASQGAIGPQGPQGPTGAQGPSGNPIAWLEYNSIGKTVWNNGNNNIETNTSFGDGALANIISGAANTGHGYRALLNVSTGSANTGLGYASLVSLTTGTDNTALGSGAGFSCGTGGSNVFIGNNSGVIATSAFNNVVIGISTAGTLTSGQGNVIIGANANTATASQGFSVAIGTNSIASTGSVAIGSSASTGAFTNCIVLGIGSSATANNQFVVGSSTQAAGAVTTETVSSTRTWTVIINGVSRKILLA